MTLAHTEAEIAEVMKGCQTTWCEACSFDNLCPSFFQGYRAEGNRKNYSGSKKLGFKTIPLVSPSAILRHPLTPESRCDLQTRGFSSCPCEGQMKKRLRVITSLADGLSLCCG